LFKKRDFFSILLQISKSVNYIKGHSARSLLKKKANQIKIEGGCREEFTHETSCYYIGLGITGVVAAEPKIMGKTVE